MSARDPRAWSGPVVGLSFIGGVGASVALSEHPYPRPGSEAAEIRRYFGQRLVPRVSATGQAVSAGALAAFTASVARLAGRAGRGSGPWQGAAVAGGGRDCRAPGAAILLCCSIPAHVHRLRA